MPPEPDDEELEDEVDDTVDEATVAVTTVLELTVELDPEVLQMPTGASFTTKSQTPAPQSASLQQNLAQMPPDAQV